MEPKKRGSPWSRAPAAPPCSAPPCPATLSPGPRPLRRVLSAKTKLLGRDVDRGDPGCGGRASGAGVAKRGPALDGRLGRHIYHPDDLHGAQPSHLDSSEG